MDVYMNISSLFRYKWEVTSHKLFMIYIILQDKMVIIELLSFVKLINSLFMGHVVGHLSPKLIN